MTFGLIGMIALLAMVALHVPIAPAALAVALIGLVATGYATGATTGEIVTGMAAEVQHVLQPESVAIVLLFVWLGNLAFYTGFSTRIYDSASVWLRKVPGGLAMASILGCGGFAGLSGSSVACASTMGRICVPEMSAQGYDPRLAGASVAVGGTVGALIPPSITFIFYGVIAELPIGDLFLAGILPGLLSLAGMLAVILWWVHEEPGIAPEPDAGGIKLSEAGIVLWPPLVLMTVLIGGLLSGLLTAWSAAAVCVGLAVLIGLIQGRLTAEIMWMTIRESVMQAAMILLIIVAAQLFLSFVGQTGTGDAIAAWAGGRGIPALTVIAVAALILLAMGMFLEPTVILILTLPIMLPLIHSYDMDPVWFGVIVVKLLEMALITPPVGLNVFVIGGVCPGIRTDRIFEGVARFLAVDVMILAILILIPSISTVLPAIAFR